MEASFHDAIICILSLNGKMLKRKKGSIKAHYKLDREELYSIKKAPHKNYANVIKY